MKKEREQRESERERQRYQSGKDRQTVKDREIYRVHLRYFDKDYHLCSGFTENPRPEYDVYYIIDLAPAFIDYLGNDMDEVITKRSLDDHQMMTKRLQDFYQMITQNDHEMIIS